MPRNIKAGPPTRKTRSCHLCDARPRGGKAYQHHLETQHPEALEPGFWMWFWFDPEGPGKLQYQEIRDHWNDPGADELRRKPWLRKSAEGPQTEPNLS